MVLPHTDEAAATQLAERFRARLAESLPLGPNWAVTASFGVAQACDGQALEALLQAADSALYAAKAGGRNQVVTASSNTAA